VCECTGRVCGVYVGACGGGGRGDSDVGVGDSDGHGGVGRWGGGKGKKEVEGGEGGRVMRPNMNGLGPVDSPRPSRRRH
jgi:hypothetical protein